MAVDTHQQDTELALWYRTVSACGTFQAWAVGSRTGFRRDIFVRRDCYRSVGMNCVVVSKSSSVGKEVSADTGIRAVKAVQGDKSLIEAVLKH
jgi:hypothetical protein